MGEGIFQENLSILHHGKYHSEQTGQSAILTMQGRILKATYPYDSCMICMFGDCWQHAYRENPAQSYCHAGLVRAGASHGRHALGSGIGMRDLVVQRGSETYRLPSHVNTVVIKCRSAFG